MDPGIIQNEASVDDYLTLCRLCACLPDSKRPMTSIFSNAGVNLNLLQKIEKICSITVTKDDFMPHNICISCTAKLNIYQNWSVVREDAERKITKLKSEWEQQRLINNMEVDGDFGFCSDDQFNDASIDFDVQSPCNLDTQTVQTQAELCPQSSDYERTKHSPTSDQFQASQIVFLITNKNKIDENPKLYLTIINLDESTRASHQQVKDKLVKVVNQVKTTLKELQRIEMYLTQNLEEECYTECTKCHIKFDTRDDTIKHFTKLHSNNLHHCSNCEDFVCTFKTSFERHQKYHDMKRLSIDMLKHEDWEIVPLGEYTRSPLEKSLYNFQINLILRTAARHKSIKPEMKQNVSIALSKFFCSFKRRSRFTFRTNKVKCDICGNIYSKKSYLQHYKRHNALNNMVKCPHCLLNFPKQKLTLHVEKSHFGGTDLLCVVCDKAYKITGQEQAHMMRETIQPVKCTVENCNRGFKDLKLLHKHIKRDHDLPEEMFKREQPKSKQSQSPVTCEVCGKTLKTKSHLRVHIRLKHDPKTQSSYICEMCGKIYSTIQAFNKHRNIHVIVKCEICYKDVRKNGYGAHLKTHNGPGYPCKYCGKIMSKKRTLKIHELRHEGIKSANCTICGINFKTPDLMKKHRDCHTLGQEITLPPHLQPVQCDVCTKVFKDKSALQNHSVSHDTGKKIIYNYACLICHKRFSKLPVYQKHMGRFHPEVDITDEINNPKVFKRIYCSKKFICSFCSKDFKSKASLEDHESVHTGEKRHKCKVCDKSFHVHNSKVRHEIKEHSKIANETQNIIANPNVGHLNNYEVNVSEMSHTYLIIV